MSFYEARLADVSALQAGINYPAEAFGRGTLYVTVQDLYAGTSINATLLGRVNSKPVEINRYSLDIEDIVIGKSSVKLEGIGYPSLFLGHNEPVLYSGFTLRIKADASILMNLYLFQWLRLPLVRNWVMGHAQRSALTNLNAKIIADIPVKFPALPEQSKVVEVLSTVDRAIEQTEALIAKQQRIKTGLMQDLLTRGIDEHGNLRSEATHEFKDSPLGRIPVEWEASSLGQLAKFHSGYAFKNEELTEHGWRVVRISNLHKPNFPYWRYEGPIKQSWIIREGDVLFSWAGVASSIDCVRYSGPDALMNQHIYNFEFESDDIRSFVYYFLQKYLPVLRTEIEGGAGQLHLTKAKIQSIVIPSPKPEEVGQILDILNQQELNLMDSNTELEKLRSLKNGLMQDLLTGKKRVTPLLDEEVPA